MPTHGRKFREAREKVPAGAKFAPDEAVQLVKQLSFAKFDETVEVATHLSVDTIIEFDQILLVLDDTCTGGNNTSHDDVLFEPSQTVNHATHSCLGQDPCCLLEGRR